MKRVWILRSLLRNRRFAVTSIDHSKALDAAANMSRFSGHSAREAQDELDQTWSEAYLGSGWHI